MLQQLLLRASPSVLGSLLVGAVGSQQASQIQKDLALGNISLDDVANFITNFTASPAVSALKDEEEPTQLTPTKEEDDKPNLPEPDPTDLLNLMKKDDEQEDQTKILKFEKKPLPPRDESSGMAADYVPPEYGPQAFDLTQKIEEEMSPEGFSTFSTGIDENYDKLKFFIYDSDPKIKDELTNFIITLKKIKGDQDAVITMYRAAPTSELREGDLLTPSKSLAQFYVDESKITPEEVKQAERKRRLDQEGPIDLTTEKNFRIMDKLIDIFGGPQEVTPSKLFEYKIKAKDLRWDGGNRGISGWGYFPPK